MNIKCDKCNGRQKGRYKSFMLENECVTWCGECLGDVGDNTDKDKKFLEEISTPFWKHMGLKPKPKDIAFEKYLKSRNMTYADHRREQAMIAKNPSAIGEFNQHVNKYGLKNAPSHEFGKININPNESR